MAITAYCGPPGSGKSYALVSEVIIPAVAAGRRVLTNVSGIKPDAVRELAGKRKGAVEADKLGEVSSFDGLASLGPDFWPTEGKPDSASGLRPGDLLVMDEVRLYWPASAAFPKHINDFLRFHRHWVAADGTSTDIVLASQLLTDFHRDYRGLIERNFRFKKLNSLGLGRSVVWNMWEGAAQRKNEQVSNGVVRLSPDVWKVYGSYRGNAEGVEQKTDRRANVLASPKLWALVAALVVMMSGAIYFLRDLFSGPDPVKVAQGETATSDAPPSSAAPPPRIPGGSERGALPPPAPPISDDWRIAGTVKDASGDELLVLVDAEGNVRMESRSSAIELGGRPHLVLAEGERVLASSGVKNGASNGGVSVLPR